MLSSKHLVAALTFCSVNLAFAQGAPVESIYKAAQQQQTNTLDTLKELVSIESGSRDKEGLSQIAALIAERLTALGGKVEMIEPDSRASELNDNPQNLGRAVKATFVGKGTKKILLIAHMDTVYLKGMLAKQPFRIDGNRAYGLGISDDKAGIAVILGALAVLKDSAYQGYGVITVLINPDEEIGSPGSRHLISKLGSEHDAVFSCEASSVHKDKLSLATSGIGVVTLKVTGRAAHAGGAPDAGRNALYELSHQILQMRDLSDPATGVKLSWTKASAGSNINVIPEEAVAYADVRVLRVADYDKLESKLQERIINKLIPDTKVDVRLDRRRPPLQVTQAAQELAKKAQAISQELGRELTVMDVAEGGGTDAAYAALETKAPVIERFGLQGYGAHSNNAEYVNIDSIVPKLYLMSRMVMEVSEGK